jgi:O-antigen/teichoic acid export membrane protein
MAFAGLGVWALVGQQVVRDVVALVLVWKLSPWRPRLEFSWKHLKDLTRFSVSNFTAQLALFADMQSSSIFLGLLFGPVAVGLYRLADRLVGSVVAVATSSIQAVSLPEFARSQDQPLELRKSALACIRLSSTMTLPALSGLGAVSGALMATMGPKWLPASGALKVLCFMGIATMFASFTGPMLQALSRPHQLAMLEWGRVSIGTALLVIVGFLLRNSSIGWQIVGIALARTATMAVIVMPVFLCILMRLARVSFRDVRSAVAPSMLASTGAVATVVLFRLSSWLAGGKPLVLLIAETTVGGIVGLSLLLALDTQLRGVVVSLPQKLMGSLAISRGV